MTKVLAINGSARMEKGRTAKILAAFTEGMIEGGASVDLEYVKKLKIHPCNGDFQCWYEKVGECIHSDDMQGIYEKMREVDILVLAIPIYLPLPGKMQNLLNRLMPIVEPILEFRDGRTRAKFHDDVRISKIVLVSTGGWWEKGNMDLVVQIAKHIAEDVSVEFSGAVLRPHVSIMEENKEMAKKIMDAAKTAGRQLVEDGKMSPDLLETISQPLISEEELRERQTKAYLKAKQSPT
ncbi:MAG: flavodoxin family protein [Candidatus Thorarchaeota archaeon]|jgi:multimeric flavodoxin WrbA